MVKTVLLKKFFVWELKNFDPESQWIPHEHEVCAFDRYNNIQRKAHMEYSRWIQDGILTVDFHIVPDRMPIVRMDEYCLLNDDETTRYRHYSIQGKYSKLSFCVDIEVEVTIFQPIRSPKGNACTNICKGSLLKNFVIKCQSDSIETNKDVLSLCSNVFKAMFLYRFKENWMKIIDFGPDVARKMVEFIETGDIANFDGYEEQLYKIADRYQIKDLMDYAIYEMVCTTTKENLYERLKLAKIYGLDEFKNWLIKF